MLGADCVVVDMVLSIIFFILWVKTIEQNNIVGGWMMLLVLNLLFVQDDD